jgi:hypothetical protein
MKPQILSNRLTDKTYGTGRCSDTHKHKNNTETSGLTLTSTINAHYRFANDALFSLAKKAMKTTWEQGGI